MHTKDETTKRGLAGAEAWAGREHALATYPMVYSDLPKTSDYVLGEDRSWYILALRWLGAYHAEGRAHADTSAQRMVLTQDGDVRWEVWDTPEHKASWEDTLTLSTQAWESTLQVRSQDKTTWVVARPQDHTKYPYLEENLTQVPETLAKWLTTTQLYVQDGEAYLTEDKDVLDTALRLWGIDQVALHDLDQAVQVARQLHSRNNK